MSNGYFLSDDPLLIDYPLCSIHISRVLSSVFYDVLEIEMKKNI